MPCCFTRKVFFYTFLFLILISPLDLLISQNISDSSKTKIIKSCNNEDNPKLIDLNKEQQRLSQKLSELQIRQSRFEEERDKTEKITPELIDEAEKLKTLGDILNEEIKDLRKRIIKFSQIVEKKYLSNYFGIVRYIGNSTIESNDKIFANVSAINGDFILNTEIKGDLAVINGTLSIEERAKVDGKIILINSSLLSDFSQESSPGIICGNVSPFDEPYNEFSEENRYSFDLSIPQFKLPGTDYSNSGTIRYNKVEGLFIGALSPKKYYWNGKYTNSIYGSIGYGFANHSWGGNINFDKWFGNEFRTEFGGEYHNLVDSKDNWRISTEENTLAAIFIHEDFKDYFRKDGWSVHASQYFDKNFRVRIDLIQDNYKGMSNNTEWSLFSKDKIFRENPLIDEGRIRSIVFGFDHITVYGKDYIPTGWNISAQYEIADGDKYEFNRFLLDLRRYQKISKDFRVNARLIIGSSEKYLPKQRTFELGGLGTIPSLGYKDYEGNRLVLLNAEVLFNISHGADFIPLIFNGNDLVVFYDAGFIDRVNDDLKIDEGFEGFRLNNLKQDLGVAFCFWRGSFRIGATFRLDQSETPKFFFRLTQPF